jgi:hypothetical protein
MLLPGLCLFSGLAGFLSSSRFITGSHYIAIPAPFLNMFTFNRLHASVASAFLNSGSNKVSFIPKTVDLCL